MTKFAATRFLLILDGCLVPISDQDSPNADNMTDERPLICDTECLLSANSPYQSPNLKAERTVQESKDSLALSSLVTLGAPADDRLTALLTQRHTEAAPSLQQQQHQHLHHHHHPALIPLPAEASSTSTSTSQFPANYNLTGAGLHQPVSDPDFPRP